MGYLATLFYICLITLWAMDTFIPNSRIIEAKSSTTRNAVFTADVERPSGINQVNQVPETPARTESIRFASEIPGLNKARAIVIDCDYNEEI